ncbi:MAG: Anti-sigma-28 factor FlgM family protein [Clostridia bacterium 41_269]|nr:MAG: Anti-sigma-28 factor FlgM family protein [Clostridia bacterium 41_269]
MIAVKIGGINGRQVTGIYRQSHVQGKNTTDRTVAADKDVADISVEALEIQRLAKKALEMEDIRAEKVEDLKKKIASGEYKIDSARLAERLVEFLKNKVEDLL